MFLVAALAAVFPAAAGGDGASARDDRRLRIVATSFPHFDWTRRILGMRADGVSLVLLQKSGADLHSFTPGASDLVKIASCDLFIYIGGESDSWVAGALSQRASPGRRTLSLLSALGARARKEVPVACSEGFGGGEEMDEHVWLSVRNAAALVGAIADEICALDPDGAAEYRANAARYSAELAALDAEFSAAVSAGRRKALLFADRFPFRYLADDYGLDCCAAFPGCSAESEASFKTVVRLAGRADELGLPAIIVLEGSSRRIAESVIAMTKAKNQKILVMDSLQSVVYRQAVETSYMDAMRRNLETVKEALK